MWASKEKSGQAPPQLPTRIPISLPWGPWPSPSPLGVVGMQGHLAEADRCGRRQPLCALRLLFAEHTDCSSLSSCCPLRLRVGAAPHQSVPLGELMQKFLVVIGRRENEEITDCSNPLRGIMANRKPLASTHDPFAGHSF